MKIKNIFTILPVAFILASCAPAAKVTPTEMAVATSSTITPIPTATIAPTYAYLPTITVVPSSTPFAMLPSILPTLPSQQSQANYDSDVIVAINSESFFLNSHSDPMYEVVLNFKNNSEKEFTDVTYWLVTYQNKDAKNFADIIDNLVNFLGNNEDRKIIPVGESDIVIDVSIYVDEYYSQCKDGSLDKPLYLLLFSTSMGNTNNPLTLNSSLNQKILEIPCK
jgi:hypothetical protein